MMMEKSESIGELSKAMALFHKNVEQPTKTAENPFLKNKYVPLENVIDSINKCAPLHGLSFTQWPVNGDNGQIGVYTMVIHESGEYMTFDPLYWTTEKPTAQGVGSVITYLKRYSLSAIFGITSDMDDDGNAGSGVDSSKNNNKQQSNKQPQQPQQQQQSNKGATVAKKITDAQIKAINAKAGEYVKIRGAGKTEDVTTSLKEKHTLASLKDATAAQASQMIKQIDTWISMLQATE